MNAETKDSNNNSTKKSTISRKPSKKLFDDIAKAASGLSVQSADLSDASPSSETRPKEEENNDGGDGDGGGDDDEDEDDFHSFSAYPSPAISSEPKDMKEKLSELQSNTELIVTESEADTNEKSLTVQKTPTQANIDKIEKVTAGSSEDAKIKHVPNDVTNDSASDKDAKETDEALVSSSSDEGRSEGGEEEEEGEEEEDDDDDDDDDESQSDDEIDRRSDTADDM